MRSDEIFKIAIDDVIICCYDEDELKRHKRPQMNKAISNKMRQLGKLLLSLQKSTGVKNFFDVL